MLGATVVFLFVLMVMNGPTHRRDASSDAKSPPNVPEATDISSGGTADAGARENSVGEGPTITGPDGVVRQQMDLGNLDARPWVYRDEADRLAAMPPSKRDPDRESSGRPAAVGRTETAARDAGPVTGDGPLGPGPPQSVSNLPGPGEVVIGTTRIGPGPTPADQVLPGPEHGIVDPDSPGPSRLGPVDPGLSGPGGADIDPDAPGPGG